MQTIAACLTFPNGTPVDALQVKVDGVWEHKPYAGKFGPTTVQNISLVDVAGNKIRASVWGHHDLQQLKGKEVVLHGNKGKGIKVEVKPYQDKSGVQQPGVTLSVGKEAVFQFVEVYHQNNPGATKPVQGITAVAQQTNVAPNIGSPVAQGGSINGQTVGMAIKAAVDSMCAVGIPLTKKEVWERASLIITVSRQLEAGNLYPGEPVRAARAEVTPAPAAAPVVSPALDPGVPAGGPEDTEDIPF